MTEVKEKPTTVIKKQLARILPYFDPRISNMGLEKYEMVVHEGVVQSEMMASVSEAGGVERFLTGLNEFAPEVQRIADKDAKAAKIKTIRENVIHLERILAANDSLKIDDPKFWTNVQIVRPDNLAFWRTFIIKCGNEPVFLDTTVAKDLIKIISIEAGGFPSIGKSFEDCRIAATPPKFYLDKGHDTAASKNEISKMKNKAIAKLQDLSENQVNKLFFIIKNIDPNSSQYTKSTSPEIIYNNLDVYINGNGFERTVKKAAAKFLELADTDIDELTIRAVIADASYHKIISPSGTGDIVHTKTHTTLGKGVKEIFETLKNPLNKQLWDSIYEEVKNIWKE